MKTIYQILYEPMSPEIRTLNALKDKVADGLYLREDEVRDLKRLVRKYNGTKLTKNHVISVLTRIRNGEELYI